MINKDLIGRTLKYIGNSPDLPKYGDLFLVQGMENKGLFRLSDNCPNCYWDPENWEISFELVPISSDLENKEDYYLSLIKLLQKYKIE